MRRRAWRRVRLPHGAHGKNARIIKTIYAMKIEVNVNVGITPAVEQVVESVLQALSGSYGGGDRSTGLSCQSAQTAFLAPPGQPVKTGNTTAPADAPEKTEAPSDAPAEAPAPDEEPANDEKPLEAPPVADDDALRYWMDQRLTELCGPEWQTSKEQTIIQLRRGCTKAFKEIAQYLGADKPTALPQEKRDAFVGHLQEIKVEPGTVRVEWKPF